MEPPVDRAMNKFGMKALRKHWGLIPTVVITGVACAMCGTYIGYMLITKPDLSYTPWNYNTNPPYKDMDPTDVRKMINLHRGKIHIDPEIVQLRKEIGSYDS